MVKALVRTGIAMGFVYGVYSVAQKFWGPQLDAALDRVKKSTKELGSDFAQKKDKVLTASLEEVSSAKKAV